MKTWKLLLGVVVLSVSIGLLSNCSNDNVIEPKGGKKSVTDIRKKSEVTEPWSLQPRWIDTTNDVLEDPKEWDGGPELPKDNLPIVIGAITSVGNVFTFDMRQSYDPLGRTVEYRWYVDGVRQNFSGKKAIITLSKDADHEVRLDAVVYVDEPDWASYELAGGFTEYFKLKQVFSDTSPLDRFAK